MHSPKSGFYEQYNTKIHTSIYWILLLKVKHLNTPGFRCSNLLLILIYTKKKFSKLDLVPHNTSGWTFQDFKNTVSPAARFRVAALLPVAYSPSDPPYKESY